MQEVRRAGVRGHEGLSRQRHWPEGWGRGKGDQPSREESMCEPERGKGCARREEAKEAQVAGEAGRLEREEAGKRGGWGSEKSLILI